MNLLQSGKFMLALQLLVSCLIYVRPMKRRQPFVLLSLLGSALFLVASFLAPDASTPGGFPLQPACVYLLFTCLCLALFDLDAPMLFFLVLSVISTQHIAVALQDCIQSLCSVSPQSTGSYLIGLFSFALVLSLCYLAFGRKVQQISQVNMPPIKLILLSGLVFAVVYVLRVYSLFELAALSGSLRITVIVNLYSVLGSLGSLIILYLVNREDSLLRENMLIEQMISEREAQASYMRETIDLINIKYHDLKHQIGLMRSGRSAAENAEILDEMEQDTSVYGNFAQTGDDVLDTVLTEKGIFCHGRKIQFRYMADSQAISFLKPADVYSLFGNILENAIEAELREPEEMRTISLQIFQWRGYLCIHAENYCSRAIVYEHGIPVTAKSDKQYHGFGIRSIRYIARKYGGNVTIAMRDNMFCLDMMLPIPDPLSAPTGSHGKPALDQAAPV